MSVPDSSRAIVLDIEGTTTPIAFVYDTLFPFVRDRLQRYLAANGSSPECLAVVEQLRRQHDVDAAAHADLPAWVDDSRAAREDSIVRYVNWLMDRDRKVTPLKDLQGRIWQDGYRTGDLVGQVFDDVAPALRRWQQERIVTAVFSSGSVLAQQLLFGHSSAGDLTPFLACYFDTSVGPKTDPGSYRQIVRTIGVLPISALFVSDVVPELDAAKAAGMRTALCSRPGNATPPVGHGHVTIRSFDELRP